MDIKEHVNGWFAGERSLAPVCDLLGVTPVRRDDGVATVAFEARAELANAAGTLHGGILASAADVAFGAVVVPTLAANEAFTTISLSTDFLRPVKSGTVEVTARLVHRGRAIVHAEAEAILEGRVVARFRTVVAILSGPR
jgi:uncharacterized protein (TIGR00369 family)